MRSSSISEPGITPVPSGSASNSFSTASLEASFQ
jgi:hypothetical protein